MKILIINQYFYPDQTALSQIITDLTNGLSERAISFEIICSKFSQVQLNEKNHLINMNIRVSAVGGTHFGKSMVIGRMIDYLSFYFFAILSAWKTKKVDVVMTTTAPPLIGLLGVLVKKLQKCKFVYNVQDLYPQTAIELNVLKNTVLISIFQRILAFIIRHADLVIAIGEDMADRIKRMFPSAKIEVIHNWADGTKIFPIQDEVNWYKKSKNLQDKFVVLYSGNFGLAHNFTGILNAARILNGNKNIHFLFIGDGKYKHFIQNTAERWNLQNVSVQYYEQSSTLCFSLSAADIGLISLAEGLEGCIVPSKIYSLMAAGQSLIFVGSGKSVIVDIITQAKCGYCLSSENGNEIANHILKQYSDRTLNRQFKKNAREYFEKHFDRKIALDKYHTVLKNVIGQ